MFGWHRLLHSTAAFSHAHLLVLHLGFPLALHPYLVNPWLPQTETLLTALHKDISEVLSTVSLSKKLLSESSNWFLVYEPNSMPLDVTRLKPLCTLSATTVIIFLGSPFPLSTFGIGIRTFCPISTSVRNVSDRFRILVA